MYWARSEGSDNGNSRPACRYLGDATILRNAGLFTDDHSVQGRSEYVPRRLQRSRVSGLIVGSSGTTVDNAESSNTNAEIFNRPVTRRPLQS